MGLRINKGPKWHQDSFGYINSDVSEMNIRERYYEQDAVADNDFNGGDLDTSDNSVLERNSLVSRTACHVEE
jgi:hypothetical protein